MAERLGCADDLALVEEIPRRGASYQRSARWRERTGGDLVAVVDSVVRELAAPAAVRLGRERRDLVGRREGVHAR